MSSPLLFGKIPRTKKISEKNMLLASITELLSEAQEKPHFRCSARRANIVSF